MRLVRLGKVSLHSGKNMALKGLQSWSFKEAGAPVSRAEILTATSATAVSTSGPTRALMGVVVPTNTEDLTLTMADGKYTCITRSSSCSNLRSWSSFTSFYNQICFWWY